MNLYINLDYALWIYVASVILVFLVGLYALVVDYRNGFGLYGSDVIIFIGATFTPIINTWMVLALVWDFTKQFWSANLLRRK